MAALYDGDWEHAEASSSQHRSQASGLVAAHLQWHLERQLRTLPLVERGVVPGGSDAPAEAIGQDMAHGNERADGEEPLPAAAPGA